MRSSSDPPWDFLFVLLFRTSTSQYDILKCVQNIHFLVITDSIPRSHGYVFGAVSDPLWDLDVSPELLKSEAL